MFLTLKDEQSETPSAEAVSENAVTNIPISEIDDFPEHPFHVVVDDAMNEMVESIKKFGVLSPAIARKKEDGRYELVSGHRRKKACEIAGIEALPVIVRDMDRDEAIIFMVDSNLQREKILPSERAFSYKMRLEAMKRRAGRPLKNASPMATNFPTGRSDEELGKIVGEGKDNIRRYIHLTDLITPLMQMVDDGKIAFRPAVELSYIPRELQTELLDVIVAYECTPSLSQAQRMKQAALESKLNRDGMELVMQEEKPQQNNITIKSDKLSKYFSKEATPREKEEFIIKALDYYCKVQERKRQERERER